MQAAVLHTLRDAFVPRDPALRRARIEQLRLVAGGYRNVALLPAIGVFFAVICAQWTGAAAMAAWLAACAALTYAFGRVARRFAAEAGPDALGAWTARLVGTNVVLSAAWASLGVIAWPGADVHGELLLVLFLIASMAGGAALTGPHRGLFLTNCAVYVAALTLQRVLWWDDMSIWYLALVALFAAMTFGIGQTMHEAADATIALREDKDGLIAELSAAKAESDAARLRAEQASRAKSAFLANMSHELRTPLNAILGFSEVMRDEMLGPIGTPQYRGYARDIHASGRHLLGLINDVLDLAKIEAGRFEPRDEEIDLAEAAYETFNLFRVEARGRRIALGASGLEGVRLRADGRAVRQALINLVANAVKFTPERGRVQIAASRAPCGSLELSVSDDGCGIPEADHHRVFESFGQSDHAVASGPGRGTGLGLPIVKGICEAHGGSVRLRSRPGAGTTVTIVLPASRLLAWRAAA